MVERKHLVYFALFFSLISGDAKTRKPLRHKGLEDF